MPSRLLHYTMFNLIIQDNDLKRDLNIVDENRFGVGNLSPDTQFYTKNKKSYTHFLSDNITYNLKSFLDKYKIYFEDDFVKGYFFHLICDKIWIEDIFVPIFENYSNLKAVNFNEYTGKEKEICVSFDTKYYNDFKILNCKFTKKYDLKNTLYIPNFIPIEEITINSIELLLNDLKNDLQCDNDNEDLEFLDINLIEIYISKCIRLAKNLLNKFKF